MTRLSDEELVRLVRSSLSRAPHSPPDADLWVNVRARIAHGAPPPTMFDWILTIAVVVLCLVQPGVFGLLLLHL